MPKNSFFIEDILEKSNSVFKTHANQASSSSNYDEFKCFKKKCAQTYKSTNSANNNNISSNEIYYNQKFSSSRQSMSPPSSSSLSTASASSSSNVSSEDNSPIFSFVNSFFLQPQQSTNNSSDNLLKHMPSYLLNNPYFNQQQQINTDLNNGNGNPFLNQLIQNLSNEQHQLLLNQYYAKLIYSQVQQQQSIGDFQSQITPGFTTTTSNPHKRIKLSSPNERNHSSSSSSSSSSRSSKTTTPISYLPSKSISPPSLLSSSYSSFCPSPPSHYNQHNNNSKHSNSDDAREKKINFNLTKKHDDDENSSINKSTNILNNFTNSIQVSNKSKKDEMNTKSSMSLSSSSSSSCIENVSPLDALLQLANSTFVSQTTSGVNGSNVLSNSNIGSLNEKSIKINNVSLCDDERKNSNTSSNTSFDSTQNDNGGCRSVTDSSSMRSVKSLNKTSTSPIISGHALNLTNGIGACNAGSISSSGGLKRKRKNRTAFTANQIFELEKRFSNQRYLSPHDRDRIAYELSLSTAQVITWFQNRRAKQKRDIEELKNDVLAAKSVSALNSDIDVEKVLKSEAFKYQFTSFNDRYENGGLNSASQMNLSFFNSETNNDNGNETDNESSSTLNDEEIVETEGEDYEDDNSSVNRLEANNLSKTSFENNNVKAEITGSC